MFKWGFLVGGRGEGLCPRGQLRGLTFQEGASMILCMIIISIYIFVGLKELLEAIFSNSEIAKSFKLSKTKYGYFINFGLAPYFQDLLVKEIKVGNICVVLFYKSLNKVLQEEQMDVQVRYWNEAAKQVNTRFFDSQFLKRPNAKNLFDCLMSSLKNLLPERILRLSMDGPNTN